MRVVVQSVLSCPLESVWNEVQTTRLLVEVAAPLVAIRPLPGAQLPERWHEGETVKVRSYLFGIIPLGTRVVLFERIDPAAREMQTRESDPLIQRWDHIISLRPRGNGCCRNRDEIEIQAGWLTAVVWVFAQLFYRHRQRRWKAVAKRLNRKYFAPPESR